ncbi:L,D-transpeptidase family protein [Hymenobacter sp. BT188]|uniref:L,D-transpeptidase family protein n=1 Tax=Hymenobacter sp. BT188 TaxID=2763504 RepID=UPI001650EB35|nr:L,D-transpeptidase family protein [Hymenobacter sp. BT188]MBC6608742.1 L,D-transpeptidase family protein [Hymenobacter sp. BT188]
MFSRLRLRYTFAFGLVLLLNSLSLDAQDASAPISLQANGQASVDLTVHLRRVNTNETFHTLDIVTKQVRQFYASVSYAPVWTNESGPTKNAQAGVNLLLNAQHYGLKPAEYEASSLRLLLDSLQSTPAQPQQRLAAEVRITTALIRFSQHLYRGRIENSSIRTTQSNDSATSFDAAANLSQALQSGQFTQQILAAQPTSRSYVRLLAAWQRMLKMDTASARQMALPVALNLERLRWEPRMDSIYLAVNIPAYNLQVVRGTQVVRNHRVVVGTTETPTPELYSKIGYFQTAPEWRMPFSIATKETLPKLKRDRNYLASKNYRLYNQAGERVNASAVNWNKVTQADFPYQIRQAPSSRNALGNVVFRFANPYEVFLHDTPTKEAFKAEYRALSHGCIRVQHASELARFLLQRDGGKTSSDRIEKMETSIDEGETKAFGLNAGVQLVVRYQTVEADGGQLRQFPDIYHRDKVLANVWDDTAVEFTIAAR